MKRTKQPNNGTKKVRKTKSKPGPKSSCTEEVIQEAHRLCLLGMTNKQLADWFDKDVTTIEHWYRTKTEFKQAVDHGRKHADGKVAESMYQTALGYEHTAVKFFKIPVTEKEYDNHGNVIYEKSYTKIEKRYYTKKHKPSVQAQKKFLAARNREQWGDAYKVNHKHAHMHVGDMSINHIIEQISDDQKFTTEELKTIAKLGLSEKTKEITEAQQNR